MADKDFQFVSSSKYDIYSKFLNVARKYTDVENTDYIKTGLFGYMTESMAMIARDSSYHKTMLYNESFLNTAVMPKTVYNWAKMFNINITSATPAYTDLVVTISTNNIEAFSTPANTRADAAKYKEDLALLQSTRVLVMDRDNPFIAGTFKFSLEKSVFIYKSKENSNAYTVKYCSTEDSLQYSTRNTLYKK